MNSIVCTLFEGDYHLGVAALINSLHISGFQGTIFAGYRGSLPKWAVTAVEDSNLSWPGARTMDLGAGIKVSFLPVNTRYHFTNFKPKFALQIARSAEIQADKIFYFDPDIVIKCRWSFFQSWISEGVGLVHEIVSNDMPPTHPVRLQWKRILRKHGLECKREVYSYINAGFFGVSADHLDFLELYQYFVQVAIDDFNIDVTSFDWSLSREHPFYANDQDALNIAAMCCSSPISEMGPEAMDFIHGGFVMSHAVGRAKPWRKKYIRSALRGVAPSLADKAYWSSASGIVNNYTDATLNLTKAGLSIASLIGRIYRRT